MHGYRVTKYDPVLRNEDGCFDDWTAISDVGRTFNGVELTMERCLEVESAYLAAVEAFAVESDRLVVRCGYDYLMSVTSAEPCAASVRTARVLGLFPEPFESPHVDDERDPYPPADEELAERVGPIPVLETPYYGGTRWHLVGAGHRPAFRPRSMIWVYARLAGRRLARPRQVLSSKVEPDFEGVLPDADGVVRARWSR